MRNVTAIMQRELLSLFCSPIGYIVLSGFLLITGLLVWVTGSFEPGKPASLRELLRLTPFVLTVIIPAITMRTISEEYRSGTIESVSTAPVGDGEFVLGKFLAAYIFYVIMIAGTLVYLIMMQMFGKPDWGASLSAYIGLLLVGLLFTTFGIFASSLTNNQIVAWILGSVPLLLTTTLAFWAVGQSEGWVRVLAQQINFMGRFEDFARGALTTDGLVFFIGTAAFLLFATVKVVESRRWR
jgi:ABC-2 type transport system permease protein